MFDWILFTVAPMIIIAVVAVPVALVLAVCAGVTNYARRRAARLAAEAQEAGADVTPACE